MLLTMIIVSFQVTFQSFTSVKDQLCGAQNAEPNEVWKTELQKNFTKGKNPKLQKARSKKCKYYLQGNTEQTNT